MNKDASRFVVPCFILQAIENADLLEDEFRIDYTVTKKLMKTSMRNRIKRRLRAAAAEVLPLKAKAGHHYVLIARDKTASCEFAELLRQMEFAFSKIKVKPTA